jgi:hypothetical protein
VRPPLFAVGDPIYETGDPRASNLGKAVEVASASKDALLDLRGRRLATCSASVAAPGNSMIGGPLISSPQPLAAEKTRAPEGFRRADTTENLDRSTSVRVLTAAKMASASSSVRGDGQALDRTLFLGRGFVGRPACIREQRFEQADLSFGQ